MCAPAQGQRHCQADGSKGRRATTRSSANNFRMRAGTPPEFIYEKPLPKGSGFFYGVVGGVLMCAPAQGQRHCQADGSKGRRATIRAKWGRTEDSIRKTRFDPDFPDFTM